MNIRKALLRAVIVAVAEWCGPQAHAAAPVNLTLNFLHDGQPLAVKFRVWLPDGIDQYRGLIINLPGSNLDTRNITTNGSWQARLPGMGFGIVGLQDLLGNVDITYWGTSAGESQANLQMLMNAVATAYNHPEISNAPILLDGVSKGGFSASYIASMAPDRTIGFVGDKGFGTTFTPFDTTNLNKVPGLLIAGTEDTTILPTENYFNFFAARAQDPQAELALAMDWGIPHANTNPLIRYAYLDQLLRARYPKGQLPSLTPGNPLHLADNIADPWLGDTNTLDDPSDFLNAKFVPIPWSTVMPLASYPNDPTLASFLPTKAAAMIFQAQNAGTFNTGTRPLQFSLLNGDSTGDVDGGAAIRLSLTLNGLISNHVELYHEDDLIAVFTQSTGMQFTYQPTETGLQTFIALAQYSANGDTAYTSNFFVVGVSNLPEPNSIWFITSAGVWMIRRRRVSHLEKAHG